MGKFILNEGNKFAILAVESVFSNIPENCEEQLSDGTWILGSFPVDVEAFWREWFGSIRWDEIRKSNVVLVRASASANPKILDAEHETLGKHLSEAFYLLQLSAVLEYEGADLLKGSVINGGVQIRQSSELSHFKKTKGYTRAPVTLKRLEDATKGRAVLEQMHASSEKFKRVMRGLNVLMSGLQQERGDERLHQFVRSLEALTVPETGKTRKQFAHRCQTFTGTSAVAKKILEEAFDMRSDTEHLNDWEKSLQEYPAADRENVAFQRARQMERLACFAYLRIFQDEAVRQHFRTESAQGDFWKKIDEAARKKIWGEQLDLAAIGLVHGYDQWGRAVHIQ